jgi:pSer/pThr/pTyr-binding forkhead associated (FHA) protein
MEKQSKIIGRDPSCDFVILDPKNRVSRKHLEARKLDNAFLIKDLNSKNGTYINGKIIPTNIQIEIQPKDVITLSTDYTLDLKRVFDDESTRIFSNQDKLVFEEDNKASIHHNDKTIVFDADKTSIGDLSEIDKTNFVTIGRGPENKHIVNLPSISRNHCQIRLISPLLVEIEDTGSTNGVYIDGEKIAPNSKNLVTSNATIRLGRDYELNLKSIFPNIQKKGKGLSGTIEKSKTPDNGPREANSLETESFKELESIWKDYLNRHKTAQSKALGFAIGGSALGLGAAAVVTAAVGPLGFVLMAGGGILGKYLGQIETSRIQNDLTFEDMFLVSYACPRCKESFQKKPWITIRECYKCKLKFR